MASNSLNRKLVKNRLYSNYDYQRHDVRMITKLNWINQKFNFEAATVVGSISIRRNELLFINIYIFLRYGLER